MKEIIRKYNLRALKVVNMFDRLKGKNEKFIIPFVSLKWCLWYIVFFNSNLMIAWLQINGGKDGGTIQLIKKFLDDWDMKSIQNIDFLECMIIHT